MDLYNLAEYENRKWDEEIIHFESPSRLADYYWELFIWGDGKPAWTPRNKTPQQSIHAWLGLINYADKSASDRYVLDYYKLEFLDSLDDSLAVKNAMDLIGVEFSTIMGFAEYNLRFIASYNNTMLAVLNNYPYIEDLPEDYPNRIKTIINRPFHVFSKAGIGELLIRAYFSKGEQHDRL